MGMRIGTEIPSFNGGSEWINGTSELAAANSENHPTLVHFWSLSCGMCKDNLPRVADWRENYREAGLRVIAVHMPRYPADTDVEAVKIAIKEYGITEPCVIDNEHKIRDAFQNEQGYVPAYYLFDSQHKLKGFAAGEYGVKVIEPTLNRLLPNARSVSAT